MKSLLQLVFFLAVSWTSLAGVAYGKDADQTARSSTVATVEAAVQKHGKDSRDKLAADAADALNSTHMALRALEENDPDKALENLTIAIGKLELLMAREPELILAPASITMESRELHGTKGEVTASIRNAEKMMSRGHIQAARRLLEDLASELVITTTNVPLGTYPIAIKALIPLIDDGKTEEAKRALQTALNTLVITKEVVPLPVIRAKVMLSVAEALADQTERTSDQNNTMLQSIAAVREQLEFAELLGYGVKADYQPIYKDLEQLTKKLDQNESSESFFTRIREALGSV